MFKTRLLSGILLVLIALFTVITGRDVLFATLLIISFIGMSELYKIWDVQKRILGVAGYLTAVGYYVLIHVQDTKSLPFIGTDVDPNHILLEQGVLFLIIVCLMILMAVYVFSYPTYKANQVMAVWFGIFYVAVMLSFVYRIRLLEEGAFLVWLVFLCSWGCDTCAYCVGMLIGKHKMAPKLSPKKSVEGGIGGVVGAALLGALYAMAVNAWGGASADPILYAIICGAGGMVSQVGDLAASAIKRNHEIKDYGTLIPGHGGILDRFDSVIFTAPIIYYLAVFFMA